MRLICIALCLTWGMGTLTTRELNRGRAASDRLRACYNASATVAPIRLEDISTEIDDCPTA